MTEEQFDKWIAALESGEYTQTREELYRDNASGLSYCCLGVLARIADLEVETVEYGDIDTGYPALTHLGLSPGTQQVCIKSNDDERMSFVEIAEWLKSQREQICVPG